MAFSATLASLLIAIGVDAKGVGSGLAKAEGEVNGFAATGAGAMSKFDQGIANSQGKAEKFAGHMSSVGSAINKGMMFGALGAAALGVESIKMAGDFEEGLTRLVSDAGEAQSNIGMISDALLKMAPEVGETPRKLADGMYMIESAGYHGAAGIQVLRATSIAAKTGLADFTDVADATTSALNAYGLKGSDAQHVTDVLLQAVSEGKMHFGDLASAIGSVLPIASQAKVSLADVGAAIATMTMQGTSAQNATQQLRMMITSLESPNAKAASTMKTMGLSAQGLANEMSKPGGLALAVQSITDAAGKKFPPGSAAYISAIKDMMGGTRNMQALLELSGKHLDAFKTNIAGMGGASAGAGKTMEGWALRQQDFNVKMQQAGASLTVLGVELGEKLLPAVKPIIDAFTSFVTGGGLTNLLNTLNALKPVIIAVVAGFLAFKAALLVQAIIEGVQGAMVLLNATMTFLSTGEWAAATASDALAVSEWAALAPMLLIVVGILAIVAVAYLLITHWKEISKVAGEVWNAVKKFVGEAFSAIGATIQKLISWLRSNWPLILAILIGPIGIAVYMIATHWEQIKAFFVNGLHAIVSWVTTEIPKIPQQIGFAIGRSLRFVADLFVGLWHFATVDVPNFVNSVNKFIAELPGKIWATFVSLLGKLKDLAGRMWSWVTTEVPKFAGDFVNELKNLPGQLFNIGVQAIQGLINGVKSLVGNLASTAGTVAHNFLSGIKQGLGISSPSKMMHDIGINTMEGMAQGILASKAPHQAMATVTQQLQQLSNFHPALGGLATVPLLPSTSGAGMPNLTSLNQATQSAAASNAPLVGTIIVNNPKGEPSEESINRSLRKVAHLRRNPR